ncbi:MAG: hypothetical protein A3F31_00165 [Candidatus Levybacteria bacterium RIFCSPHIGHO2_12_FULL_38_12]|nr:MAG: hypothetical protein A3F31_00165 [Candidatus Levybacteria bacterium RIFCSPHIGHO2_12_FULL_38_12]
MFKTIIICGFLACVLVVFAWVFVNNSKIEGITSPLPIFLTRIVNSSVTTLDLWIPQKNVKESSLKKPDVSARSALMYDITTGQLLYAKNIDEKLPLASLTKIMTAVIALENRTENDTYYVDKSALVGEDSMGLTEGEALTLKELLYGLFLVSGNDAAEVLAWNYQYGRKGFLDAMNNKARSLGLSDTHFTNPSGLEGDGNQYTTAYDLLVISRYAIVRFPLFNEVVGTVDIELPYSKFHKYFYLQNETNLLTSYSGVKGVKTGFTPEAGLCLVTYYEGQGHKIIGVVLGSNNRRDDMKGMLDYSLKLQGIKVPKHD